MIWKFKTGHAEMIMILSCYGKRDKILIIMEGGGSREIIIDINHLSIPSFDLLIILYKF